MNEHGPSSRGWSNQQLYEAFKLVYSDYPVPFSPTPEQFAVRLKKLNLDIGCSGIKIIEDQIVAFILYTINHFKGKVTAYNGGTGVVPEHRGQGLIDRLFDKTLPQLYEKRVESVLLEVIDSNHYAVKLYERLGFEYQRTLKSFKLNKVIQKKKDFPLTMVKAMRTEYQSMRDFEPSFIDSDQQLPFNLENESIVEANVDNELAGYIIFQPALGRVSQFAIQKAHRRKGLATALFSFAQTVSRKPITVLNVPEDQYECIHALEALGFVNELNQFELEYLI